MAARPDRAGRQTCEGYAFVGAEFHLRALFDGPFLVCLRLLRRSIEPLWVARKTGADSAASVADEYGSGVVPIADRRADQPRGSASTSSAARVDRKH
jgi:hypothetical protein